MTDTPTLTAEQIEALAQQVEKMTPGDWSLDHDDTFVYSPLGDHDVCTPGWIVEAPEDMASVEPLCAIEQWKQNCRGIVALRNAAPALIAAARTLADVPMKADAAAFGLKFFLRVHASEAGWDGINAAIDAAFAGLTRGLNDKAPAAPAETE